MRRSILLVTALVLAAALAAGLAGCSGGAGDDASAAPSAASPSSGGVPFGEAGGTKMAPGLYDLEDGSVVAVGTVEHRDLEGGFWAVIGGTESEGDAGSIVAVIANGDQFEQQFRGNEGLSFEVYGERAGDASIRMAGPEIVADRVILAAEGGPAD
jgi:hypothetical protein